MPVTIELIIVDLKDGVGKDDATLKKLREGAAKGGLKRQSYGLTVEHPNKLYWALCELPLPRRRPPTIIIVPTVFENGFELKDFKWPAEEYGNFAEQLKTVSTSDFTRYFVTVDDFPAKITAAPVVETVRALKAILILIQLH